MASAVAAPITRAAFPRVSSSKSGFFFCGMALLPVAYASGQHTKSNSCEGKIIISSAQRLRCSPIIASADVQPQIGGNLLVAASSAVEFVPSIPDKFDQDFLYEVMNIFSFGVFKKRWRGGRILGNLLQSLQN